MPDRLIIIGQDGQDKILIDECNRVVDLQHEHEYTDTIVRVCIICGLSEAQILEDKHA